MDVARSGDLRAIAAIRTALEHVPEVQLDALPADRTALLIVDMLEGFTREGALASPRALALVPEIAGLMDKCKQRSIAIAAFADMHSEHSPEFRAYPRHCVAGSSESRVIRELEAIGGYTLLPKNSTNGCVESPFREWLDARPTIDHFIMVGVCTDICIEQMSMTIKAIFNSQDRPSRVIVPANAVDTFDALSHAGDFMHLVALYFMMQSGVEVVSAVV
jgi:nicotinamidase-related amidase